jgi:hypothetical protein
MESKSLATRQQRPAPPRTVANVEDMILAAADDESRSSREEEEEDNGGDTPVAGADDGVPRSRAPAALPPRSENFETTVVADPFDGDSDSHVEPDNGYIEVGRMDGGADVAAEGTRAATTTTITALAAVPGTQVAPPAPAPEKQAPSRAPAGPPRDPANGVPEPEPELELSAAQLVAMAVASASAAREDEDDAGVPPPPSPPSGAGRTSSPRLFDSPSASRRGSLDNLTVLADRVREAVVRQSPQPAVSSPLAQRAEVAPRATSVSPAPVLKAASFASLDLSPVVAVRRTLAPPKPLPRDADEEEDEVISRLMPSA